VRPAPCLSDISSQQSSIIAELLILPFLLHQESAVVVKTEDASEPDLLEDICAEGDLGLLNLVKEIHTQGFLQKNRKVAFVKLKILEVTVPAKD
jgi:hypothetical protein